MKRFHLFALVWWLTALMTVNVFAQWPDSASDNMLICDHPGEQALPKIAATSDNGCYILWYDHQSGNYDVYLQKLDGNGNPQWTSPCGILVSANPQETWLTDWDMTVDPADYCIIAVNDSRAGGDWDIYGYRISPAGDFVWGPNGIAISNNANFEPEPRVCVTSAGNAVFAWQEQLATGGVLHLRKIDANGLDLWDPATITLTGDIGLTLPRIVPADDDAFLLQYVDLQGTQIWDPRYVYMMKFDAVGLSVWGDPVPVTTAGGIGIQVRPDLIPDGSGGAYSFWYDTRTNNQHHVRVQHIDVGGTPLWTTDGVNVDNSQAELQMSPAVVQLQDGLVVYYQATNTSQSQGGIQVQRLNSSGEPQWDTGIVVVPLSPEPCFNLHAFAQMGNSSIFFSQYVPGSGVNTFLRASQQSLAGPPAWDPPVRDLCSVASDKGRPDVTVNSAGQILAAWPDSRIENDDIYIQNINPDGSLGPLDEPPSIEITSPAAPNDTAQVGSTVNILFEVENFVLAESGGDGAVEFSLNGEFANYFYDTQTIMLALVEEGVHEVRLELVDNDQEPLSPRAFDIIWLDNRSQLPPSITIISPAQDTLMYDSSYVEIQFLVQNFDLSESGGDGWINVVIWFTPGVPEPVIFADFYHYTEEPFIISFEGLGDYQISLTLVDTTGTPLLPSASDTVMVYYVCINTDHSLRGVPACFSLPSAYPNPFNPETTIRFDVQKTSHVSLKIHDLLGREVNTLLNTTRDAGSFTVIWNGRNDAGESVPSGVYFVKMNAAAFTATRKLMLIR